VALMAIALTQSAGLRQNAIAAIIADSANDICGPTADPCHITQAVTVIPGSLLDFGTRAVQVSGNGVIDVGAGTGDPRRTYPHASQRNGDQAERRGARWAAGDRGVSEVLPRRLSPLPGGCHVRCGERRSLHGRERRGRELQGKIMGNAEYPGAFVVRAGGAVRVGQRIQLNGNTLEADGGTIDLDAAGSLFVDGPFEVNSGGDASGGSIEIDAGRNIEVVGGTSSANLYMTAEGHTGYDGATAYAGDGGYQDYAAGGSILLGRYVRLRANGALPDASGDEMSLYADGSITIQGSFESRERGALGSGGFIDIDSADAVTLTSTANFDARGGEGGGGEDFVAVLGDAGAMDLSASNGGIGGLLNLDSDQKLTLSGVIANSGISAGQAVAQFAFHGCRIDVLDGASVSNLSAAGRNAFYVADRFKVFAGAAVRAGTGGQHRVQYRDPGVPPQLLGVVTPTAISGSCDDDVYCNGADICLGGACALHAGNPCSGQPECLNVCDEGSDVCRAPYGSPCWSDGNVCTDDVCNGLGGCSHVNNSVQCDNGVFCDGPDFCVGGACSFSVGNPCDPVSQCAHLCDETVDLCRADAGDLCSDDGSCKSS
jgi:hypothetical protein